MLWQAQRAAAARRIIDVDKLWQEMLTRPMLIALQLSIAALLCLEIEYQSEYYLQLTSLEKVHSPEKPYRHCAFLEQQNDCRH